MKNTPTQSMRRQLIVGAGLSIFLSACEAKKMKVFLDISLFSYLERPIFDVTMNGSDFGAALARSFYGANSVMVQQPIILGPQVVSWRLDGPEGSSGNGDTVIARNAPLLIKVEKDIKWLALHIYNDGTVEISLSKGGADELQTPRGEKIVEEWRARHVK